jgi:hypothetical protein
MKIQINPIPSMKHGTKTEAFTVYNSGLLYNDNLGINLGVIFLYSRYASPNVFSSFASSAITVKG